MQPLAFSKELLPVGGCPAGAAERPRAVSEYLIERMVAGGATRLCFVIGPGKSDIVEYYGAAVDGVPAVYVVQPAPSGLCDALFRALPLVGADDAALVGLPDTVWFPADGFRRLPAEGLSFLLFPVERPELFDAVLTAPDGTVREIRVKQAERATEWIWGAFRLDGRTFAALHALWLGRERRDEYLGTLVNAWLAAGGRAHGVRAGETYVDVGTLHGYRHAMQLLAERAAAEAAEEAAEAEAEPAPALRLA
ncbi:MAG TPA: nucleotidyltransferase family protein [Thermoanaerobaculia bacterium]|nr:nucleotidyltransferase family protein [Thermoanaerobaculia bacterium]